MGLQRQTRDPYAFGSARPDDDGLALSPASSRPAATASRPGPSNAGNDVLESALRLARGQPGRSRRRRPRPAASAQAILKQMLPVIAAMLMGGLSKIVRRQRGPGRHSRPVRRDDEAARCRACSRHRSRSRRSPGNPFEAILKGRCSARASRQAAAQIRRAAGRSAASRCRADRPASARWGASVAMFLTGMFGADNQNRNPSSCSSSPKRAATCARAGTRARGDAPTSSAQTGPGSIGLDALNQHVRDMAARSRTDHQNALKDPSLDAMLGRRTEAAADARPSRLKT